MSSSFLEVLFASILLLYVASECLLTILQTHQADRSDNIQHRFFNAISRSAHRKAIDYIHETTQARLFHVVAVAFFILSMTWLGGISWMATSFAFLTDAPLLSARLVAIVLLSIFLAIEFPLSWYLRFRIEEKYGFIITPSSIWTRLKLQDTLLGFFTFLPFLILFLWAIYYIGRSWPVYIFGAGVCFLFWRFNFAKNYSLFWGRQHRTLQNPALEKCIRAYLQSQGLTTKRILLMTQPERWKNRPALLTGHGKERTVILFTHTVKKLKDDEILAVVACEVARTKSLHSLLFAVLQGFTLACCMLFSYFLVQTPEAFTALHIEPSTTILLENMAPVWSVILTALFLPILLHLIMPFTNAITRQIFYQADIFVANTIGAGPLIRALIALHRHERSAYIKPSHLYSLFHYPMPPTVFRIENLQKYSHGFDMEKPRIATSFQRQHYLTVEQRTVS